jgi:hypothetical protein
MQASELIRNIFQPRDIRQLPIAAIHAVMAMRLCVICHKADRDPVDDLLQRFGNDLAVRRFQVVFEVIGTAWPDAFTVSRPCCSMLSPDESMFANMMMSVAAQNRAAFDIETRDMLDSDVRETLFATLEAFERARISGAY